MSSLGGWASTRIETEIETEITLKRLEALVVGLDVGYWDGPPRTATTHDVADVLGVTQGPASRRLRGGSNAIIRAFLTSLPVVIGCPLCGELLNPPAPSGRGSSKIPLKEHLPRCPAREEIFKGPGR